MSRRTERVAREVHETVARLLLVEGRDPAVASVVVTRVEMTADLKLARVYWRRLAEAPAGRGGRPGEGHEAQVASEKALRRAAGWLRGEVGRGLGLKASPAIEFHYDQGQDHALRVEALLRELGAGARAADGPADPAPARTRDDEDGD